MSDAPTLGVHLSPLGDQAILVRFGDGICPDIHRRVWGFCQALERERPRGVIEWIPAYDSVCVTYDVSAIPYQTVSRQLSSLLTANSQPEHTAPRVVEIPVCYDESFGPDLSYVAQQAHLTVNEVIELHGAPDYLVYMIGFTPGFPYLGGMDKRIAAPRRDVPRAAIPAGSVGIAGVQTGVYPISTPGGWQLIGRTPLRLFHAAQLPPTRLEMGDTVRFSPITRAEFEQLWEAHHETSHP